MAIEEIEKRSKRMSLPLEIRYISKKIVKPAETLNNRETAQERINLSPWDLKLLSAEYNQKGLLYRAPKCHSPPKDEETSLISHLLTSLSRTLDYFYHLAGRLATKTYGDNTISFHIDCNNMAGVTFIHAASDVTVSDILDPPYVPQIVHSFFPLNGFINLDGLSQPLLAVQVTELIDGVFVGCTMNHAICDGTSLWHFMNSWSQISRSCNDHILRFPIVKRWFLNDFDCPIRFSMFNKDQFVANGCTLPPLLEKIFNFSPQSLAKLKAKANREQGTTTISTLQALLGHVWRAVARARCLDSNQEIGYVLVIGNRARLNPKLPQDYNGNSTDEVRAMTKAGELIERGLGWAGWLLNQAVASHDDTTIRKSWEDWIKKPTFICIAKNIGYNLITGSSPRFNMYGNDFGWGRPVAVRSGCGNKVDGEITVYQGETEGSIDVEACLLPQALMAMEEDKEFMELVTT